MGYVTKWLIIEEFSIILNHRILSEKWVGMLRIIQAERINSTIKNEIFSGRDFHSLRELHDALTRAVDFYNNERPHMSIGMMTPAEASTSTGDRDMKWTSYRELAIKRIKKVNIAGNNLPLNPCHGSHSGYALQSTHDRDNKLASKLLSGITKEK
jgi:hypothetical protein